MKKKMLHLLYIAGFLLICLIPFAGMAILGPSEAVANEIQANPPKLTNRDGSFNINVADDTEEYIADRFAFRQELITLWAKLNGKLLRTSVQEQVILGEEDWLYYASTENDYMGHCTDSSRIAYAAANLALMQEYADSLGAEFTFAIAPNKNSLYPEYMPAYYPRGTQSNAKLLLEELNKQNVCYTNLYDSFRNTDEVLYFRTDSHWNGRGAALAADAILQSIGKGSDYYNGEFTQTAPHTGDLYEMLYPTGNETEADYTPAAGFSFRYDTEPNNGNAIKFETSGSEQGNLVCWRDSFGISLHPYLADAFGTCFFSRSAVYDLTELQARDADAVVIELVERNLSQLWENAPILPAPTRSVTAVQTASTAVHGEPGKDAGDLIQILIPADDTIADTGSPLYVQTTDAVYECCVIYDGDTRLGSAYLPADTDTSKLHLIAEKDGQLTAYSVK